MDHGVISNYYVTGMASMALSLILIVAAVIARVQFKSTRD